MTDGEAAPGEEAAAERHLARCPACRTAAAGMTALTRWLRVRPAVPRHDFVPALLAAFDARNTGTPAVPLGGGLCGVAQRPRCVPDQAVMWGVGAANCGCARGCDCGCQKGRSCRCHASVA